MTSFLGRIEVVLLRRRLRRDIRLIQQLLRHARLDTTQIYTEVAIKALREVHAKTHPSSNL